MEAVRIDIVEIEQRLQSYDWNEIMYDPLQDFIEADTDEEKLAVAGMEQLIDDLQQFYLQSPEQASLLMEKYWNDKPMEHWIERIKREASQLKNLERLSERVAELGFPPAVIDQLKYHQQMNIETFDLFHKQIIDEDTMRYQLTFSKENEQVEFISYGARLREPIELPDKMIDGVDIRDLDTRMSKINWNYDQHLESIVAERIETPEGLGEMNFINDTLKDFDSLYETREGKEIASLLSFKHWSDGYYSRFIVDRPALEMLYERKLAVMVEGYEPMTINETYQILKAMKPQELNTNDYLVKGLEKEHVIANEVVNKAERESLTGGRFLVYNTDAYFLSSRQVHFFKDSQVANAFVLEHPTKAYKIIEFDSVQDMLKKIPYGSIVAEQQEKYSNDLKNELVGEEKILSGELLSKLQNAMANGESWMAYNGSLNNLSEIYFFSSKAEAEGFASDNISDRDQFSIKYVETIINKQKNEVMNEQNMQYLKDNIKYMGFGEGLNTELENQLKSGKTDFQLQFRGEMNKKPFEATLNFRKSDNTDMYFFNSYHAKLERSNGETKEQTFYLDKGKGVTAKEAFNLLEGRAVHKELTNKNNEPYKAWLQLDFSAKDKHNNFEVKQYHENYGYDLRAAVGKLSVSELGDPEKEKALLQSLQKGNIQSVSMDKDGSSIKMFIEANPQFKTVNVYDGSMKRVQKEDLVQYQSKAMVKEPEQSLKQETSQKKTAGKKDVKSEDSLLPKKRTSQKKGLGIA